MDVGFRYLAKRHFGWIYTTGLDAQFQFVASLGFIFLTTFKK